MDITREIYSVPQKSRDIGSELVGGAVRSRHICRTARSNCSGVSWTSV